MLKAQPATVIVPVLCQTCYFSNFYCHYLYSMLSSCSKSQLPLLQLKAISYIPPALPFPFFLHFSVLGFLPCTIARKINIFIWLLMAGHHQKRHRQLIHEETGKVEGPPHEERLYVWRRPAMINPMADDSFHLHSSGFSKLRW